MKNTIAVAFILALIGCVQMKETGLYDQPSAADNENISGFYALTIFKDQITNDVWFTDAAECIRVLPANAAGMGGSGAISLEWNKQATNCPWMGMGIGWENWSGKNFESIIQNAALSFWVKMKQGESKGLPWAVGFEDFNGGQAWTGATADCIVGGTVKEDWTQVIIPLSYFPFESTNTDVTSIKQVIFQFESSGKVWIDNIGLIPYKQKLRQEVRFASQQIPQVDGVIDAQEWPEASIQFQNANVKLNWDDNYLYIAATVIDETPLVNNMSQQDIWNGDALEIAFSTLPEIDTKRKIFYESDQHIGLRMSVQPIVYDWVRQKLLTDSKVISKIIPNGYVMEAAISWKSIDATPWQSDKSYDLELALDMTGNENIRTAQYRWNSGSKEGFNFNPSLWGKIYTQF